MDFACRVRLEKKLLREGWAGKGWQEKARSSEVTGASLDDEGEGLISRFPATNEEWNLSLTSRFSQEGTSSKTVTSTSDH